MTLIMITNLITPHQIPVCNAFYQILGDDFTLIETMNREKALPKGWAADGETIPYVISSNEISKEKFSTIIDQADCVIIGAASLDLVRERLHNNKLTFRYAERVYKQRAKWYEMPLRTIKYYLQFGRHKSFYLLCASGFTYADYLRTKTFCDKAYKWGYFPLTKRYDVDELLQKKTAKENVEIMWAGRMLDWKHPECAVDAAVYLKSKALDFHMTIIGNGPMKDKIVQMIAENDLTAQVTLKDEMTPAQIRNNMENADIFLFTSDRYEGWGATLNEAMNSGCAVVCSHLIGAVPFMVNGENALVYKDGDIRELCEKTTWAVCNQTERCEIGKKAYETVVNEWNGENAARKFISLCQQLLQFENPYPYDEGVCSRAEKIADNWYKGRNE